MLPLLIFGLLLLPCSLGAATNSEILGNATSGQTAPGLIQPELRAGMLVTLPDGRSVVLKEQLPDGRWQTNLGFVLMPNGTVSQEPGPVREKAEEAPLGLSLVELLPMTRLPEKSEKETEKKIGKEVPRKEAPRKEAPRKEAPRKEKLNRELRIPPEAAKTGNLDFLEGCWQGTRPEYYSKRTIKECFCFGAHGENGKRRVLDPLGKRQCIGATKANLSSNGVLSVTSSGAACSDGERWGQAEMICRNNGPKTPCSWVFRDANNGRQAYEIPFVRVESCGR